MRRFDGLRMNIYIRLFLPRDPVPGYLLSSSTKTDCGLQAVWELIHLQEIHRALGNGLTQHSVTPTTYPISTPPPPPAPATCSPPPPPPQIPLTSLIILDRFVEKSLQWNGTYTHKITLLLIVWSLSLSVSSKVIVFEIQARPRRLSWQTQTARQGINLFGSRRLLNDELCHGIHFRLGLRQAIWLTALTTVTVSFRHWILHTCNIPLQNRLGLKLYIFRVSVSCKSV